MERPETRYAWNGDVSLAYQVVGDGPTDLLYLQGYCSQVDMNWESPYLAHFLRGLARHARLIVTDRRGWGCSERFTPGYVPDVDILTDDILAVLGAVGSDRASILATYESTIVASLFAAVYPDRTRSLILVDPQVTYLPTDETPWMPTLARWQEQIQLVRETWGTLNWWDSPHGPEAEWFSRYARASAAPGGLAAELTSYLETDIRAVLPSIHVPTLVLVDTDSFYEVPPETGRFAASKIRVPASSSTRARAVITSTGMSEVMRSSTRSRGSWRRFARRKRRSTAFSRPFSSPTSSNPRTGSPSWAISAGASSSSATTRPYGRSSPGIAGRRWTLQGTGSSPPSTDRRAPCAAPWRSWRPFGPSPPGPRRTAHG